MPNDNSAGTHFSLNPVIWEGDSLKPEVRTTLLKIAEAFYAFLKVDVPVIDVVLSGSQANFNYTQSSDLDLHVIIDFNQVNCDIAVLEFFDAKRKLWKEQHSIDIYNIPVEAYVEDLNNPAISAFYSLRKNAWVRRPVKVNDKSIDEDEIERVSLLWIKIITSVLKEKDAEHINHVKNLLATYRKIGLAKQGEFGIPNLVFKSLRNTGVINMLVTASRTLFDKRLSLD